MNIFAIVVKGATEDFIPDLVVAENAEQAIENYKVNVGFDVISALSTQFLNIRAYRIGTEPMHGELMLENGLKEMEIARRAEIEQAA